MQYWLSSDATEDKPMAKIAQKIETVENGELSSSGVAPRGCVYRNNIGDEDRRGQVAM
jgi:hypothetical protein